MRCERCGQSVEPDELREHHGRQVCEDCYMDLLSPTRMCDPWAVHSAKSTLELAGGDQLSDLQQKIMQAIEQSGGISLAELVQRLDVPEAQLEKEVAALRHMEKLRAQMHQGRKVLVAW